MKSFPLVQETLPGGLRCVLLPRDQVETVTFLVLIGVGSRYETPRQWGLSHFLEHMFFKGTETRPDKKEIAEAIDNIGGEFNAFTGQEYTGYFVKVAKEHLQRGADVVSDILIRPLFPPAEIERERGVIIEEIRMYTDMPMRHIDHLWQRALFGDHPLGRRIDGTVETVSRFVRRDFMAYTKQHYHTENAVVAVAGNFEVPDAVALLRKLFRGLPKGKETQPRKSPGRVPIQRFMHEIRPSLDQTHLIVGVPGVSYKDARRWPAELLAVVLGGGMSSRLFLSVREEHGLAYAVRTSAESFTDGGSLATQAGLRTDKAVFALQLILKEYDRAMTELVPEAELTKAKQIVRGRLVLELEETNAMAVFAGGQALLEKRVETPADIWRKVSVVTPEDVRSVARELLHPKRRALALLSPHTSARPFTKLLGEE